MIHAASGDNAFLFWSFLQINTWLTTKCSWAELIQPSLKNMLYARGCKLWSSSCSSWDIQPVRHMTGSSLTMFNEYTGKLSSADVDVSKCALLWDFTDVSWFSFQVGIRLDWEVLQGLHNRVLLKTSKTLCHIPVMECISVHLLKHSFNVLYCVFTDTFLLLFT